MESSEKSSLHLASGLPWMSWMTVGSSLCLGFLNVLERVSMVLTFSLYQVELLVCISVSSSLQDSAMLQLPTRWGSFSQGLGSGMGSVAQTYLLWGQLCVGGEEAREPPVALVDLEVQNVFTVLSGSSPRFPLFAPPPSSSCLPKVCTGGACNPFFLLLPQKMS